MKIVSARRPGSKVIGRAQGISRLAKARLKWLDHCRGHGENAALTCRYFGISRQTFYRWKRRYNPRDLTSLEERSHRPRRLRQPTWSRELALAVLHLREQYPRWGKDKLAGPLEIAPLNQQLRLWELTYNTVRPHQALGYLTPQQFLCQQQSQRKEPECH